jgi:hypothetical protein
MGEGKQGNLWNITKEGLNSLIILGAWTIWNHRNKCVFEGASPNMVESLILLGEERRLWMLAGARGLSHLTAPSQEAKCGVWSLCCFVKRREFSLVPKCVCVVMGLFTLWFNLFNIMKRNSPAFSRKK